MLRKLIALGVMLTIVAGLAACGSSEDSNASVPVASVTVVKEKATSEETVTTLNDDYADALPVSSQLAIGTLMLEGTDEAVSAEQAGELLPNWQMLEALQSSGTTAQAELDAVLTQIQAAMTSRQLAAIKDMQLTLDSLMELVQEQGLRIGTADGTGRSQTVQAPAGVAPGAGGGPGGGFGAGGDLGADDSPSPDEKEAAVAERMNALAGTAMTGTLVSLLEARTEGESWEIAAPNQAFELQRTLVGAVAEATGLEQQEITMQTREGKTLAEITAANGGDVDEIVAQVVAAETERISQSISDGTVEQTDADQSLADLEARVKELLEGTLQLQS